MQNRLGQAMSPYLLAHATNPVDWWEWSDEAFARARESDVPVFLSIGYAACHWCHVMAHESFDDEATATYLNEHFVSIKVDREERPDVDSIYMSAVQGLSGHGGWPMTVFLNHRREPFYAGTYFPPEPRHGTPSFTQVLEGVIEAWTNRRSEIDDGAAKITQALAAQSAVTITDTKVDLRELATHAVTALDADFDTANAGFGDAPKFPPSMVLEFLLRHHARTGSERALIMANLTCEAMARGGMYDQLAGGFSRYSVDATWTVPHFEKMLYDNALLLSVYAHLFRQTGSNLGAQIVYELAEFLISDLRTSEGGFGSSLDADSPATPGGPAHEGAAYVWTRAQLIEVLGEEDGQWAVDVFGVTDAGTFENGASVLQMRDDPPREWSAIREKLMRSRNARPQPPRDEKVVAAWNGLAIGALAEAGALMDEPDWIAAANVAAALIVSVHIVETDGMTRIRRVSRDGIVADVEGVLADYADVASGFLSLSAVTGDQRWRQLAGALLETAVELFGVGDGHFVDSAASVDGLIVRPREMADLAEPSGTSAMVSALLAYGTLMGRSDLISLAEKALAGLLPVAASSPRHAGWVLSAMEAVIDGPREVVIVGARDDPHRAALHRKAMRSTAPGLVVALGDDSWSTEAGPFLDRHPLGTAAAAYVCRFGTCSAPVATPEGLGELLARDVDPR